MIGRGKLGGGGGEKCKEHYKAPLFGLLQLVRRKEKKKRSTIEQASNEAFAKKSWRYPFANPDSIYIYTVSLTVKIKEMGKPASFYKDR